uniref:Uncharacterized protein n=1 Tax=viral metagenome TaxID=1070528 RepID=A0A6C0HW42_9ZZZZ
MSHQNIIEDTLKDESDYTLIEKIKKMIMNNKIKIIIILSVSVLIIIIIYLIKNTKSTDTSLPEPVITKKIRTISPNSIIYQTRPTVTQTTSSTSAPTVPNISSSFNSISLGTNELTSFINLINYDLLQLVSTSSITISATISNLTSGTFNIYIGSYKTNIFDTKYDQSPLYGLLIFFNPNLTSGFGFRRRAYNIIDHIVLQQTMKNTTNLLNQTGTYNVEVVLSNFNNVRGTFSGIDAKNNTGAPNEFVSYPILTTATKYCNIKMTITNISNNEVYTIPDTITWYNGLNFNNILFNSGSGTSPNGSLTISKFKTTIKQV